MVVAAWDKLGEETVRKSFFCCGQSPASPENITCIQPGQPVQEAMEEIKKLWAQLAESLTDTELLEEEEQSKVTIESEVNAEEEDEDSDVAMVNDFNNNEHQK